MVGKPCIKGTRIPVDMILEELAHGREVADLLEGYRNWYKRISKQVSNSLPNT